MADTINLADWQLRLGNPQSLASPYPVTLASAATIAPQTYHTIVTGTVQVATITVPYTGFSGTLAFTFTDASPGATLTTGNIILATTVVRYKTLFMTYEPISGKWYPSY